MPVGFLSGGGVALCPRLFPTTPAGSNGFFPSDRLLRSDQVPGMVVGDTLTVRPKAFIPDDLIARTGDILFLNSCRTRPSRCQTGSRKYVRCPPIPDNGGSTWCFSTCVTMTSANLHSRAIAAVT